MTGGRRAAWRRPLLVCVSCTGGYDVYVGGFAFSGAVSEIGGMEMNWIPGNLYGTSEILRSHSSDRAPSSNIGTPWRDQIVQSIHSAMIKTHVISF